MNEALILGSVLIGGGALIWAALWIFTRRPGTVSKPAQSPSETLPVGTPDQATTRDGDALLIVEQGGRVRFVNPTGQSWLDINGAEPNLERIARRIKPTETFWRLCQQEGQAILSVNGRAVEAASYSLPSAEGKAVQVILRRTAVAPLREDSGETLAGRAPIHMLSELNQAMAASLDLEDTLQAVLASVERLIPADYAEITLWDAEQQHLTPYRFTGVAGESRRMIPTQETVRPGEGYSGVLIQSRRPLLVSDIDAATDLHPLLDREAYPYRSYLGVPLQAAGDLVGTLELASLSQGAFGEQDQATLQLLSGQAAVALKNAQLFEQEQRKQLELASLAKMAQASNAIAEPQALVESLVDVLHSLIPAGRLGFLRFDTARRAIIALAPFHGIPDEIVDLVAAPVDMGSDAEDLLASNNLIEAEDAALDERFVTLGLHHLAQAAGMRQIVLAPLAAAGRPLGFLLAANPPDGQPWRAEDLHLMRLVSSQAAPVLENARLINETRQRAQRSEALRRLSNLAGSIATLEEILKYSVQELTRLLQAELAVMFLLDEQAGELRAHIASAQGLEDPALRAWAQLPVTDTRFTGMVTQTQRGLLSRQPQQDEHLPEFYRQAVEQLSVESLIVVPLVVRDRGIGELVLARQRIEDFNEADLTFLLTAANQLAGAIERSLLSTQTDASLRKRVDELAGLIRLSRELQQDQQPDELFRHLLDEALRITQSQGGRLTIRESLEAPKGLLALSGEEPTGILAVEEQAFLRRIPVVQDGKLLASPVMVDGQPAGMLTLWKPSGEQYDPDVAELAQALSAQAALVAANSRRAAEQAQVVRQTQEDTQSILDNMAVLEETLRTSQERLPAMLRKDLDQTIRLQRLQRQSQRMRAGLEIGEQLSFASADRQEILNRFARLCLEKLDMDAAIIVEMAAGGPRLVLAEGLSDDIQSTLGALLGQRNPLLAVLQNRQSILCPNVEVERAWRSSGLLQTLDAQAFACFSIVADSQQSEAGDALAVLLSRRQALHDLGGLDGRLIQLLAGQAGFALHNQALHSKAQRQLNEVSTLLGFSRRLSSLDENSLLQTLLGSALQVAENAHAGMVALWQPAKARLIPMICQGYAMDAQMLRIHYNAGQALPGKAFESGQTLRVHEIDFARDYNLSTQELLLYRSATGERLPVSSLIVPIRSGEHNLGVLVLDNFRQAGAFNADDEAMIRSLGEQTALALENARLYRAAEDRARQMESLAEAGGRLGANLQMQALVGLLLQQLRRVVPADTTTLWLREDGDLVVHAVDGSPEQQERLGVRVAIAESQLLNEMIDSARPLMVSDVQLDDRFPSLVELPYRSWLGLPLVVKGEVRGAVTLEYAPAQGYTPADVQAAATFAAQAAIALDNASLYQDSLERATELHQGSQRLGLLNRLSIALSQSLQIDDILKVALTELSMAVPCQAASAILFDRLGRPVLTAEVEKAPPVEPVDDLPRLLANSELFTRLGESETMFVSMNAAREAELRSLAEWLIQHETRAILAAPVTSGGRYMGVIVVHRADPGQRFTADELDLARTICNQAALSIQNARLYSEAQDRLNELVAINQISNEINARRDLTQLIESLPGLLSSLIDTSNLYLALYDSARDRVMFPLVLENGSLVQLTPRSPIGLTGHILRTGKSLRLVGENITELLSSLDAQQYGVLAARSYLGVPLRVGEQVIGVLAVQSPTEENAYSEDDERLLSTMAAQIAVAVDNNRHFTETRQRSSELALLFEYGVNLSRWLDESRLIETTFEHLPRGLTVDILWLVTRQPEGGLLGEVEHFRGNLGRQVITAPPGGLLETTLVTNQPLLIADLMDSQLELSEELPSGSPGAWMSVPLVVRGEPFGVLAVYAGQANLYDEDSLQWLGQIVNQLSVALDNARLFKQVQSFAQEMAQRVDERTRQLGQEHARSEALLRIITELSASLDMDIVLNRTLGLVNQAVGAEQSSILLVDTGERPLMQRASMGYARPQSQAASGQERPEDLLAAWVIEKRQTLLIDDLLQDERWQPQADAPAQHRSALLTPLMVGEDTQGVLLLFHRQPGQFSRDQLDLVQATANQIAVAINNAKLYRLIRDQAERLGDMLRTQHVDASRSQAILEAIADGVLVTDAAMEFSLFNASAERILRLDRQQVLNRSLDEFAGLFGKSTRAWTDTVRRWSSEGGRAAAENGQDVFIEQVELDGGQVLLISLSPVRLRNEFLGTVSIVRDITHEVEVDRLKSEFVANVSHELRTPMTSIKGYVEIMLAGMTGQLTDQQKSFLDVVRGNTERMIVLVNDLLDVSQIDAGQVLLNQEPLDLRELAGDALAELMRRSDDEKRPMDFRSSLDHQVDLVMGDRQRLRQVLENLLDNAYHYTPGGGQVSIRVFQSGDWVQVDVQDNGIGIPKAQQTQVFERFYRGEDVLVLETPGTGLGLAVVRTLVEMHGGRIWLESTGIPGEGSTFSFSLPVRQRDEPA